MVRSTTQHVVTCTFTNVQRSSMQLACVAIGYMHLCVCMYPIATSTGMHAHAHTGKAQAGTARLVNNVII